MNELLTFPYAGVLFNTLTVIIGSLLGLSFKKNVPAKLTDAVMCGVGICTVYIGISGAISAGSDPQANASVGASGTGSAGIDNYAVPSTRSYNVSFQLTF